VVRLPPQQEFVRQSTRPRGVWTDEGEGSMGAGVVALFTNAPGLVPRGQMGKVELNAARQPFKSPASAFWKRLVVSR
jgi:hypothetical protein